jgi:hypothetical protein
MRVVLGHDWLRKMREGEKLAGVPYKTSPRADILTLRLVPRSVSANTASRSVKTPLAKDSRTWKDAVRMRHTHLGHVLSQ